MKTEDRNMDIWTWKNTRTGTRSTEQNKDKRKTVTWDVDRDF